MASITMCGCSLSHLLKRSIDLIDPGRHHQSSTIESGIATATTDATQNDAPSTANHNNKKTVSFSSSCAPSNNLISVNDAKLAYDLLLHATSISSSSSPPLSLDGNYIQHNNNIVNEHSSWKDISIMKDVYRALIVASNLILELLPHDTLSSSSDMNTTLDNTKLEEQYTKLQQQTCPLLQGNNDDPVNIPSQTPTIIKDILSTIRRSILLLQLLEHVCAIKSISQKRRHNNKDVQLQYYEGGDDIHDYDRSTKDLLSNYDWHDDGYLPQPFTHHDIADNNTTNTEDDKKEVQSSNILQECCYRPTHPTDPPSSKHERSAYTRDWIRGDRIVSLCVDDYSYFDDDSSMIEVVVNDEIEVEDDNFDGTNEELNYQADDTDNNIEEEHISLNLSRTEFEEEEGRLMDIMLADNVQQRNTQRSKAQVKRNAKERKKRKRQNKNKRKQNAEEQLVSTSDATTTNQVKPQSYAGEGFLLLICEDKSLNILQHLQNNNRPCNNDNRRTKTIRIYVKLHPSGWLSIEDCSIREREAVVEGEEEAVWPLPSRIRHLDLFIGTQTKCQPCTLDNTSSFKLQLSNIRLLGASSSQSSTSTSLNEQVDIMLSVDEGTGGDFMDGFEWVNTLSGAANARSSLLNSIQSEWGMNNVVP